MSTDASNARQVDSARLSELAELTRGWEQRQRDAIDCLPVRSAPDLLPATAAEWVSAHRMTAVWWAGSEADRIQMIRGTLQVHLANAEQADRL